MTIGAFRLNTLAKRIVSSIQQYSRLPKSFISTGIATSLNKGNKIWSRSQSSDLYYYDEYTENDKNLTPISLIASSTNDVGVKIDYYTDGTNEYIAAIDNGQYATTSFSSPGAFRIFKKISGNWTPIFEPNTQFNGNITSCHWHPSGNAIAVAHSQGTQSTYSGVRLYTRSGDSFTEVNLTYNASYSINDIQWSPDGTKLAVGSGGAAMNYYDIMEFNTSNWTYTQMTCPNLSTSQQIYGLSWSSNSSLLALRGNATPYFQILQILAFVPVLDTVVLGVCCDQMVQNAKQLGPRPE